MATERNIDDILSEVRAKRMKSEDASSKKSESTIDEILRNIGINEDNTGENKNVATTSLKDSVAEINESSKKNEEKSVIFEKPQEKVLEGSDLKASDNAVSKEKIVNKPKESTMKTIELSVELPTRLVKTAELERKKIEEERERRIIEENRLREERITQHEKAKKEKEEAEKSSLAAKHEDDEKREVSPIIATYVKNAQKREGINSEDRPVVTTSREFITSYFNSIRNGSKVREEETIEKIIDFKEKQLSGEFDTKAVKKAITDEMKQKEEKVIEEVVVEDDTISINIAESIGATVLSELEAKDEKEYAKEVVEDKKDVADLVAEEIEEKQQDAKFEETNGEFIEVSDIEMFRNTMELNVDKLANDDFERYQQNLKEQETLQSDDSDDEYDDPVSKENIKKDIKALINSLSFRLFITLIPTIALVYIDFAQIFKLPILDSLLAENDPMVYIFSTTVLTLLIVVTNILSIIKGLSGITKPNSDTPIAILALVSAIATTIVFFNIEFLQDQTVQLFNSVVAVGFLLNLQGKVFMAKRIERNFKFISTEDEKYSCNIISDKALSSIVDEETENQHSVVATHIKSKFLHKFLKNSYSQDPMDRLMPTITFVSVVAAVIVAAISFALRLPAISILTTTVAAFAFTLPVCSTIVSNYPIYKSNKKLFRWGAVVTGYLAAENADKADVIACTDNDLLPNGSITLGGIKPFADNRIDKIILYAASVFIKVKSSLAPLFLDIIDNELTMLYKIETLKQTEDGTIEAFADDKRIVIGTRKQLGDHGLFAPSKDFEDRFVKGLSQSAFYIAINGEIAAMFVLNFEVRDDIKASVKNLVAAGFKIVVSNKNQNIDEQMLEEILGVQEGVYLASENLKSKFDEYFEGAEQNAEASIAHKGSFESFAQALLGVIKMRFTVLMGSYCQFVAVIVGAVISLLLTATSSITDLTAATAMLYQIIWVVLLGLFSTFRK